MPISADIYNAFAPRVQSPQDVTNGLMREAVGAQALQAGQLGLQERRDAIADRPRLQARADEEHAQKLATEKEKTKGLQLKNAADMADLASRDWVGLNPNDKDQFVGVLEKHVKNGFLDGKVAVDMADKWDKMSPDDRLRFYYQQGLKGVDMKSQAQLAWQAEEEKGRNARNAADIQGRAATNAASNARMAADSAAGRAQSDRHFNASQAGIASRHADAMTRKDEKPEKPLLQSVVKQVTEARDNAATVERASSTFKPEYASKGILGFLADTSMAAKGVLGWEKDAVGWWKDYRKQAELVERHALFGAALTPTEQASWRSADIHPGMDADVIKANLATRAALARKVAENTRADMIDAGHSAERIDKIAGRNAQPDAPTAAPAAGGFKYIGPVK